MPTEIVDEPRCVTNSPIGETNLPGLSKVSADHAATMEIIKEIFPWWFRGPNQ